jgi:hypothetical protein
MGTVNVIEVYLIHHVSAEELTTGWMTPLGVNSPPVEDIGPVIEELTTGWMTLLGINSPPVEDIGPVIVIQSWISNLHWKTKQFKNLSEQVFNLVKI